MFGWKKFAEEVKGIRVEGDPSVRRTTVWNRIYMQLWGWKKAAVLKVDPDDAKAGYRWGLVPTAKGPVIGQPMLTEKVFHDETFRVRIGHEDCMFFAIDDEGAEVPISLVARTTIRNGSHGDTPLR